MHASFQYSEYLVHTVTFVGSNYSVGLDATSLAHRHLRNLGLRSKDENKTIEQQPSSSSILLLLKFFHDKNDAEVHGQFI